MTLQTGFTVPTLATIIARIAGDLNSYLEGVDAFVPGSDEWVIAQVMGGANYSIYGYQAAILRETFVQTASAANLETIGGVWGVTRNQATASTLTVDVTAAAALTIPAGTLLTDINGLEFHTDVDLVFGAPGTSGVNVTCQSTGADTTLEVGAELTFSTGIANVTSEAPVTAVVTAGSDIEGLEAYRARILARIQNVPQGGSAADYERWALEVDGVDQVWVDQPTIGYARTVHRGTALAATVQAYIDDDTRKPVGCTFVAVKGAEYGLAVDVTVTREDGYSLADVTTSIKAEITSLCENEGGPGLTLQNSEIRTAVGMAEGVDYYVLNDIIVDGVSVGVNASATAPSTEYHALDDGNMAVA